MDYTIGATLKEKTRQHPDVKDRIASFGAFLNAHNVEMQKAADKGKQGIYISIIVETCIANEAKIAKMLGDGELCGIARQFGLHIENVADNIRLNNSYYAHRIVSFDLCWL